MLFCPDHYKLDKFEDINDELLKLEGELDNETSKITLAKFLRYNLPWTIDLMSHIKLAPYQIVALKAMFLRNYSLFVFGRGCAKSYLSALASFFIPIFEPETNIVIAAPTFRAGKNIFAYMEKISKTKEAILLRQCLGAKEKRNDLFSWEINGGSVKILPCNGDKLRGFRANVLILDEYRLLSEDMVKNVLVPFLVAPSDISERMRITEKENELIRKGLMKEDDRKVFSSTSRMICLSSASYTFEHLFKTYEEWYGKICENNPQTNAKYFIQQVSWDSVPKLFMEKNVIDEARSSDETHPSFQREYCARFVDGSESYFSAKKMSELTIKDGNSPSTKIKGDFDKKYILSLDPNYNDSPTSDHFAMSVLELNEETETATLVHSHACAGAGLKEYINYLFYLLKSFNIVMICCDNMDGGFLEGCNQSSIFQENEIKLGIIDYDSSLSGEEYIKMLKNSRTQYNLSNYRICFKKVFNQSSIRMMNEQLQTWINTKKIWFASKLTQHQDYGSIIKSSISYPFSNSEKQIESESEFIYELISIQDDLIQLTKQECALIEVRVSPNMGQTFDFPMSLKRNTTPSRARKDSYTSLLLAVECAKAYNDIMKCNSKTSCSHFLPVMYGKGTYKR